MLDMEGEGMVEPLGGSTERHYVLMARVMTKLDQGYTPLRLINVTVEPQVLHKGMKMGEFHSRAVVIDKLGEDQPGQVQSGRTDALIQELGLHKRLLSSSELRAVSGLLHSNYDVFSSGDHDLGRTQLVYHKIVTGDAQPIKMCPRRVPVHFQAEVNTHLREMQNNGIIRPSHSPWAASVVLVRKKDGG